jgi:hypothetical protein
VSAVRARVRARGGEKGLREVLPPAFLELCLKSDAHREWCEFLVHGGRRPSAELPPELLELVRYLIERGVVDKAKLREIGSELEKAIVREIRDAGRELREAIGRAVAARRPEVVAGEVRGVVERLGKIAPVVRAVSAEPEELVRRILAAEVRPAVAGEVARVVGRPATAEEVARVLAEGLKAEARGAEELHAKVSRVEEGREVPPVARARAELRQV